MVGISFTKSLVIWLNHATDNPMLYISISRIVIYSILPSVSSCLVCINYSIIITVIKRILVTGYSGVLLLLMSWFWPWKDVVYSMGNRLNAVISRPIKKEWVVERWISDGGDEVDGDGVDGVLCVGVWNVFVGVKYLMWCLMWWCIMCWCLMWLYYVLVSDVMVYYVLVSDVWYYVLVSDVMVYYVLVLMWWCRVLVYVKHQPVHWCFYVFHTPNH